MFQKNTIALESLFTAVQIGNIDQIQHFKENYNFFLPTCFHPTTNLTLMEHAACYGQLDVILFLIKQGVDPTIANPHCENSLPIHYAALYGHKGIMLHLNQSSEIPPHQRTAFNATANEAATCMHAAAAGGHKDIMILLNSGNEVPKNQRIAFNVKTSNGVTPMHWAGICKQEQIMEFLSSNQIPEEQRTPRNVRDNDNNTPEDLFNALQKKGREDAAGSNQKQTIAEMVEKAREIKLKKNQTLQQTQNSQNTPFNFLASKTESTEAAKNPIKLNPETTELQSPIIDTLYNLYNRGFR